MTSFNLVISLEVLSPNTVDLGQHGWNCTNPLNLDFFQQMPALLLIHMRASADVEGQPHALTCTVSCR